jgi:hypothetical protein
MTASAAARRLVAGRTARRPSVYSGVMLRLSESKARGWPDDGVEDARPQLVDVAAPGDGAGDDACAGVRRAHGSDDGWVELGCPLVEESQGQGVGGVVRIRGSQFGETVRCGHDRPCLVQQASSGLGQPDPSRVPG